MTRIVVDKSTDHTNHIRFVFYHKIKDNEIFVLTTENTDSDLKVHVWHYGNELLLRVGLSVKKLLQTRLICRNNTKKCLGNE